MIELRNVPLSSTHKALSSTHKALSSTHKALSSTQSRKSVEPDFQGVTPFAQAIAEYLSLSGPWNEETGEHAGEGGYTATPAAEAVL
jgi:hypothetical protein